MRRGEQRAVALSLYDSPPDWQYAELHTDGAAVAMNPLFTGRDAPAEGEPVPVLNLTLIWHTAKALNVVAKHATQIGGWGELAVELAVFGPPRILVWVSHGRFIEHVDGARITAADVVSKHTFVLEDPAAGTQPLLAATRLLLTDVFNAFGSPEVQALTPTGALNTSYLPFDQQLPQWAEANGVDID
jgi:hypothetical protein